MCALLNDPAIVDDHDPVRVGDGREPVRNDERDAALEQPHQRRLDYLLGLCVDRRRCFV